MQDGSPSQTTLAQISERARRSLEGNALLLQLPLGQFAEALPRHAEQLRALQARLLHWLTERVERGIRESRFRSDLNAAEVAQVLFALHLS